MVRGDTLAATYLLAEATPARSIMFNRRYNSAGIDAKADLTGWLEAPPEDWRGRILAGVLFPLILIAAGLYCIIAQRGLIVGRGWYTLRGTAAVAQGIAALGAALFFHAHAFWGPVWRLPIIHELGRIVGAIVFIGGFGYVLWSAVR